MIRSNKELLKDKISSMDNTETVIYKNSEHKIVYVNLSQEHAERLLSHDSNSRYIRLHDTESSEIHLVPEHIFPSYLEKRKIIPQICLLYHTIKELKTVLQDTCKVLL